MPRDTDETTLPPLTEEEEDRMIEELARQMEDGHSMRLQREAEDAYGG